MSAHVRGDLLVVEDEPTIAEVVGRYLERAGYAVRIAGDGAVALELAREQAPDLVVLDLMLPRVDGLEVLRRLRDGPPPAPAVILLTARGDETDRVTGLRLGADDYVVKPFSPDELVARVDAVLRRTAVVRAPEETVTAGDLEIDAAGRRVLRAGTEVPLTQREFDLLLFLARHPGRAFSREELMDRVWQFAFYTDTATVTVHIRRLRGKLGEDVIATVRGHGYRFALPSAGVAGG